MPKLDLHIHTKFSDHPSNFFLKKMKAPESLTEPLEAYQLAKRRGMDFVTLTDSDSIKGCLELSQFSDAFTSCETAVAFPEDDIRMRLIVLGLNEQQLQKILTFRLNIFEIRDYLLAENLFHAVASPLEVFNPKFGPDHVEKLLLLFDHFETRSGSRQQRTNEFLTALLDHLNPEFMDGLQKKWKIKPAGEKPWQKGFLGGSNDYCGQYIGLTWTEVPQANSPQDFIEALRARKGTPAGIHGGTLTGAHNMYRVGFQFYQKNLHGKNAQVPDLLNVILARVLQPSAPQKISLAKKISLGLNALKHALSFGKKTSALERKVMREFIKAYREEPAQDKLVGIDQNDLQTFDERLYHLIDRIIGKVSYRLATDAAEEFSKGNVGNALGIGAAILPIQAVLGPYLYSYDKLNRDRPLIEGLQKRFQQSLELPTPNKRKKIAWFSDTVTDVNGVSLTLHKMAAVAEALDADLTIICSVVKEKAPQGSKFLNFEPIGEITVPNYELQKLTVPPLLKMLRHLEQTAYDEYVISTPAGVGLIATLAAKLFNVPSRSIYHSDFPQHVKHITGDESLEEVTWKFMRWFYGRSDVIYSPSNFYKKQLVEHGFDGDKIFIFTRGTDLEFFNPKHRDENFYQQWGIKNRVKFVYTGRVSREKNLDILLDAFVSSPELLEKAALIIVGDGPYTHELRERYNQPAIAFPGFMKGKMLSTAYASADVFVFPSTTDTYGNSVLEAQASGLPAIVSDEGGPIEIISPDESGIALSGYDVKAWSEAMKSLTMNSELRHRMASAARARTATRDWQTAFKEFWDDDPYTAYRSAKNSSQLVISN